MVPACTGSDDGRHRWRYGLARWSGTPRYVCDGCSTYALPTGDGVGEDYAYLGASGEVVRDDGRTPHRVRVDLTMTVELVVLARDYVEAQERAEADALDLVDAYAGYPYPVTFSDPEASDVEAVAGEVMPA